jgi:hypothetical protein
MICRICKRTRLGDYVKHVSSTTHLAWLPLQHRPGKAHRSRTVEALLVLVAKCLALHAAQRRCGKLWRSLMNFVLILKSEQTGHRLLDMCHT